MSTKNVRERILACWKCGLCLLDDGSLIFAWVTTSMGDRCHLCDPSYCASREGIYRTFLWQFASKTDTKCDRKKLDVLIDEFLSYMREIHLAEQRRRDRGTNSRDDEGNPNTKEAG